jgi:hypothetical protein
MSGTIQPEKRGGIAPGIFGLVLTIAFCVVIAAPTESLSAVSFACAVGLAGLAFSIAGIARRRGRKSGVAGIVIFALGCLMTYATIMDFIAHARGRSG